MNRIASFGAALLVALLASQARAGVIDVTATYTSQAVGANFDYTITLTNNSPSDTVGTFWFSWIPGENFLNVSPTSVTNPTGWTSTITHGGSTDGYAIQWVSSSVANNIAVGSSLSFSFVSSETPAQLAANSNFFPTTSQLTSFVYNGAPFSADSERFVVTQASTVPEPSSLALSIVAGLGLVGYRRFARKAR